MTPAEKEAKELIEKFKPRCAGNSQMIINTELSKQCALICVERIIFEIPNYEYGNPIQCMNRIEHWQQVKQAILNYK